MDDAEAQGSAREPTFAELKMLLLLGQAATQEHDPWRIALWITEGVSSLLGSSLAVVVLVGEGATVGSRSVYGELDGSPLPEFLRQQLGELADAPTDDESGAGGLIDCRAPLPELGRRGMTRLCRVPIRTLDRSFGVLLVGCTEESPILERERFILTTLSNQAAIALENARLRERLEQRVTELERGAHPTGGLAPDPDAAAVTCSDPALVATKLQPPPLPPDFVPRARLVAELERGLRRKLTLFAAPPGAGKTTVVAEWHEESATACAWLNLDSHDSDPVVFWTYVGESLRTARPELSPAVATALAASPATSHAARLAPLFHELAGADPLVLVLDSYHAVDSADVQEGVAHLLEHMPPALHLVIVTRPDPPLPLGRLRAQGELTEIRAADLAFTIDEANALLNDVLGLGLDETDVARLVQRTEGWAAGLWLAVLSLRDRPDPSTFIEAFAGEPRHMVDYLGAEVLGGLDDRTRSFLRRTSILEELSAPLCDAVTHMGGAAEMLPRLERANLFLTPVDSGGEWYRHHQLFANLLRYDLRMAEADLEPTLHRRAASWYRDAGRIADAIDHALAGGDYDVAGELIGDHHWIDFVNTGQVATVERWLGAFPVEVLRADGRLSLARARTALVTGDIENVESWLRLADRAPTPRRPLSDAASLPAGTALLWAVYWRLRGDLGRALEAAERAIDLEPTQASPNWVSARASQGLCLYLLGRLDEAWTSLTEAAWAGPVSAHNLAAVMSRGGLAAISMDRGAVSEAEKHARIATEVAEAKGLLDHYVMATVRTSAGRVLEAQGDLAGAEDELRRGVAVARRGGRLELADALVALAHVCHARGDPAEARALINEARATVDGCADPGTVRDRVDHAERELGARRPAPAARAGLGFPLTERELTVLRLLPTQLSYRDIAHELYVSSNTVKTHVRSLYQKLGVASRQEAVRRAEDLGLLPGLR